MNTSKSVNKLVKEYAKKLKPNLRDMIKKTGKVRIIEKAYYHGYFEALRQNKIIEDKNK